MMKAMFRGVTMVLISVALALGAVAETERREEGNLVIEGIPEIPQSVIDRMFQYQSTREAVFQDWDTVGGGMLVTTRFGETTQVHQVAEPSGARRQITFFSEPVRDASICPDPKRHGFLFSKDVGGGEVFQIFFFDLESGQYRMLTDGKSRNGAAVWSNKGDRFAFFTTQRNGTDWDVHVFDFTDPGKSVPVLEKSGFWIPVDWSPDDERLLVIRYVSANESYYHILDIATGELTQINPSEEKIAYGGALWAKDGKSIYITSDEGSEFSRLRRLELKTGKWTVITADIPWDVEDMELSEQGDMLAFTANEDGASRLYLLDTSTLKYEPVPGVPMGQIGGLGFHPAGGKLALAVETPKATNDAYSFDLKERKLTRWTESEVGGLNTEAFVEPQLIHYPTFDKVDGKPRMISAFYFKPRGKGPHPVVINIHGGPEAQYRPGFSPVGQYYLGELGIAVIAPNVRGSAGYGKSFIKLDNGFNREDTVRDIGALLDWIGRQEDLDASRVAVVGGSYGGYMVLAAMVHYNERLRAGVDVVGISNFVTFLENTGDYRRDLRRVEYGDERDPEMRAYLEKISPSNNSHKITKPMFIIQGYNDPRVPVTESEQMLDVIRKNGGDVWYLLAMDEGHGFRKKTNRDYYSHAVVMFLEEKLLK